MRSSDPRHTAFVLLRDILGQPQSGGSDATWTSHPEFNALSQEHRATCLNLVQTTLRHLGSIDALLAARIAREPRGKHRAALHILRLGVAELLWLDTPAYAAVNSYVELAKKFGFQPMSGMVNAVLKRIAESGIADLAMLDTAKINLPVWLWQHWTAAYGEDATRRITAIQGREPPLDLTLKSHDQAEDWAQKLEATLLPTGSLRRNRTGRIDQLPGFREGEWWVQDASAALPVKLMPPLAGRRVLDMCAAPGGKTAQLAAAHAEVTALERSESRLARMRGNLDRLHLTATLIETDALDFTAKEPFDRVLLDAPCTATGTIRRHPEVAWKRTPQDVTRLAEQQRTLLAHAATLTAPGGVLVYSVCSLEPEEGERQIEAFLHERPDFRLLMPDAATLGFSPAWLNPRGMLRILPCYWEEHGGMDGFFAAALIRAA